MRTEGRKVFVLGLVLLFVGCHELLGDYTLVESDISCASGNVQCVGNVLQRCNKQGTGWDNLFGVCIGDVVRRGAGPLSVANLRRRRTPLRRSRAPNL